MGYPFGDTHLCTPSGCVGSFGMYCTTSRASVYIYMCDVMECRASENVTLDFITGEEVEVIQRNIQHHLIMDSSDSLVYSLVSYLTVLLMTSQLITTLD